MIRIAPVFLSAMLAVGQVLFIHPGAAHAQSRPTLEQFVTQIVAPDLDSFWGQSLRRAGRFYTSPRIRLAEPGIYTFSACSPVLVTDHGYCPQDKTLYLDLSGSNSTSFGSLWWRNRDFAIVTIMAHEWGHYIQDLTGQRAYVGSQQQLELQADCLAGIFTRWAQSQGRLDVGDLDEVLEISVSAGDPVHGSGQQRVQAFMRGFQTFSAQACGLA